MRDPWLWLAALVGAGLAVLLAVFVVQILGG